MDDHDAAAATNAAADAQSTASAGGKKRRRTPEQKVAYLRAQLARATAQQNKRSRQLDTREKIVIGGAVIKTMRVNEAFRSQVIALLQDNVTRDVDREAIASWLAPISTRR